MPLPLVIPIDDVRDCLIGEGIGEYLNRLGSTEQQNRRIEKYIRDATAEVERLSHTYLIQRVIHSYPGEGTRGVDYDVAEDAYTWFPEDWHGFGQVRLKKRPIVSVEQVAIKYGQHNPQLVLLLPQQWKVPERKAGILHIQPIVAMGSMTATALVMMPLLTQDSMRRSDALACIVHVNYTAGYLPKDFDAEVDDPRDACPDFDCTGLLKAIAYKTASEMLLKIGTASDGDGGSISVDGASETITPGRLDKARQSFDSRVTQLLSQYGATEEMSDEAEMPLMALI